MFLTGLHTIFIQKWYAFFILTAPNIFYDTLRLEHIFCNITKSNHTIQLLIYDNLTLSLDFITFLVVLNFQYQILPKNVDFNSNISLNKLSLHEQVLRTL